jgi:hypothetical protein
MAEQLSYYVENLDNIPQEIHQFYTESDDGFLLSVDGVVPKAKLNEFRTTNRKLNAELEEVNNKFKYVDVEEYKTLKENQTNDAVKGVVQESDVNNIVDTRVKEMKVAHNTEITSYKEEIHKVNSQLSTLLIDNAVTSEATKHSVKSGAVEDILLRAKRTFAVNNGQVEAHNTDGEIIYNNAGDPLTITEWITDLGKAAPHLFQESTGALTQGNKPGIQTLTPHEPMSPRELIAKGLRQNK